MRPEGSTMDSLWSLVGVLFGLGLLFKLLTLPSRLEPAFKLTDSSLIFFKSLSNKVL